MIIPPVGILIGIYTCRLALRERVRVRKAERWTFEAVTFGFIFGVIGTVVSVLNLLCLIIVVPLWLILTILPD